MAKDEVIHSTRNKLTLQFIIFYIIWIDLDYVADIAFEPDANIKLFQKMMENDCWWEWIFQLDPRSVATARERSTCSCARITWNTLGALTREARAEESVAEKMPAVMRGPNPDTMLMTLRREVQVRKLIQQTVKTNKWIKRLKFLFKCFSFLFFLWFGISFIS